MFTSQWINIGVWTQIFLSLTVGASNASIFFSTSSLATRFPLSLDQGLTWQKKSVWLVKTEESRNDASAHTQTHTHKKNKRQKRGRGKKNLLKDGTNGILVHFSDKFRFLRMGKQKKKEEKQGKKLREKTLFLSKLCSCHNNLKMRFPTQFHRFLSFRLAHRWEKRTDPMTCDHNKPTRWPVTITNRPDDLWP